MPLHMPVRETKRPNFAMVDGEDAREFKSRRITGAHVCVSEEWAEVASPRIHSFGNNDAIRDPSDFGDANKSLLGDSLDDVWADDIFGEGVAIVSPSTGEGACAERIV